MRKRRRGCFSCESGDGRGRSATESSVALRASASAEATADKMEDKWAAACPVRAANGGRFPNDGLPPPYAVSESE